MMNHKKVRIPFFSHPVSFKWKRLLPLKTKYGLDIIREWRRRKRRRRRRRKRRRYLDHSLFHAACSTSLLCVFSRGTTIDEFFFPLLLYAARFLPNVFLRFSLLLGKLMSIAIASCAVAAAAQFAKKWMMLACSLNLMENEKFVKTLS